VSSPAEAATQQTQIIVFGAFVPYSQIRVYWMPRFRGA
jgi:hypothetical protein